MTAGGGGATTAGNGGATSAGKGGATSAGNAGATSAGSSGATAAGAGGATATPIPVCQVSCTSAADCATAGVPIFSAANYACKAGACAWLGCATDTECQQTFQKAGYACDKPAGQLPSCVPTCSASADCATAGVPIYAADHYTCTASGRCEWGGCKSDVECQETFQKPGYRCGKIAGLKVNSCYQGCNDAADCAIAGAPIYSADHYACNAGRCDWKGCTGDTECQQTFMKSNYVCR